MGNQASIASFVVVIIVGFTLIVTGNQADNFMTMPLVIGGVAVLIGGTIAIYKWIYWFQKILKFQVFQFKNSEKTSMMMPRIPSNAVARMLIIVGISIVIILVIESVLG